jgi:hypothetical protein
VSFKRLTVANYLEKDHALDALPATGGSPLTQDEIARDMLAVAWRYRRQCLRDLLSVACGAAVYGCYFYLVLALADDHTLSRGPVPPAVDLIAVL